MVSTVVLYDSKYIQTQTRIYIYIYIEREREGDLKEIS